MMQHEKPGQLRLQAKALERKADLVEKSGRDRDRRMEKASTDMAEARRQLEKEADTIARRAAASVAGEVTQVQCPHCKGTWRHMMTVLPKDRELVAQGLGGVEYSIPRLVFLRFDRKAGLYRCPMDVNHVFRAI